ncbi:hypothetical protein ACLRGI_10335 [Paenarthrobacter nitroguajacolicus]|uniref:hypothetical protein n=1 Tax=Paenarthrobacter nitroguajacolicus TaxID=211146 RepID=UPI003ADD2F6B
MSSTIAPQKPCSPYGTEAHAELQRHHWQALANLVCGHRPDWPISDVIENLWDSRNKQSFPDLARTALMAAMNPANSAPVSIYFAAAGVMEP